MSGEGSREGCEENKLGECCPANYTNANSLCMHTRASGVGDLYTDPQIHTAAAKEYGEANLGPKGMALFFSSHICSPLCQYLGLTQFDLSEAELERVRSSKWSQVQTSQTVVSSSASQSSMGEKINKAELGVGMETVGQAFRRLSMELNLSQLVEGPTAPRVPETPLTPPNREGFENGDDGWDYDKSRGELAAAGCDGSGREDTATKVWCVCTVTVLCCSGCHTVLLACVCSRSRRRGCMGMSSKEERLQQWHWPTSSCPDWLKRRERACRSWGR